MKAVRYFSKLGNTKTLREKGILVEDKYFYAHMLHIKGRVEAAKAFGRNSG